MNELKLKTRCKKKLKFVGEVCKNDVFFAHFDILKIAVK